MRKIGTLTLLVGLAACGSSPDVEPLGVGGGLATGGSGVGAGLSVSSGGMGGGGGAVAPNVLEQRVRHALDFAEQQLAAAVAEVGHFAQYPETAEDGAWTQVDAAAWTSGFFAGCLWLMHEHTGRGDFRAWAEQWTATLDNRKYATGTHDVGFQIMSSYGQGLRIAAVAGYQDVLLTAASSLDTRYDSDVGCIRSWDWGGWAYPVIIDGMMNLELMLEAASRGGPAALRDHAVRHAERTAAEHIRADGTTYHVVDYDPASGDVLWRGHAQGATDESTWARGMAWGIYGFTMVHRHTGEPAMLATAERLAGWFIDHLPADHIPYWDFEAPDLPHEPRDTSAAAIAASALMDLADAVSDPARSATYRDAAHSILHSLTSTDYLAEGTSSSAILRHGYYHGPKSVIFGDYYFIEAALRYLYGPR
ncbi:MAG: glycoside hydrolase family 88 protein [Deltaproteobacteria bacterium]|jgi:unsaturated chondroitin disaccharide hydrolase|nr:glycoside hydrolase family 88 protein [Deltaproteobacteria bacterium]MBW2531767.1 glycoside hydrolase family 88 protein [Deltaproteobacteria bacterium]